MGLTKEQFVRLMEKVARVWIDNDTPMALAYFTEDAVYIEPPGIQLYRGHNQLRLFFADLTPGTTMVWHNLWFDEATQKGVGEYSFSLGGSDYANHGVAVIELRDGLIASWREYQQRGPISFESFLGLEDKQASPPPGGTRIAANRAHGGLQKLKSFLERIPAISGVETSKEDEQEWWAKFSIDIELPVAWHVVQELGHVLNYISLDERLATIFMPVSPPPYLNGGPDEYLSWVVEAKAPDVDAGEIAKILEGHLPNPVEDEQEWLGEDDEEEDDEEEDDDDE